MNLVWTAKNSTPRFNCPGCFEINFSLILVAYGKDLSGVERIALWDSLEKNPLFVGYENFMGNTFCKSQKFWLKTQNCQISDTLAFFLPQTYMNNITIRVFYKNRIWDLGNIYKPQSFLFLVLISLLLKDICLKIDFDASNWQSLFALDI